MSGGNPLPPAEEDARQRPLWERWFWLIVVGALLTLWALARPS